ncbi:ATP-dependent DNA helicase RecQ [Asanoa ishikariensis]|uniref:ATP-dependent DNA helicase RecQ n=1 Tax=Asanoa ishikariensis TaxID=137265 RepID=A0A1H3TKR7_9ACTN|nr:RecQ family ATP-dependent DNA helicase [Asanoa ishikariensis]GIF62306.1 ATP-dependent DNA helicase RecQ [Asanoa ishikariensis]SDZ50401.1 ATP-dependent DNA helicase RecQ [Asanoa ishikariensis]
MEAVDQVTRAVFGFDLRPGQRAAAESITSGRDTLAVLPTGSGKSAIYQVGGLVLGGLTVVVSPLIALQRDQVASLSRRKKPSGEPVRAVVLNSSLHKADRTAALEGLHAGQIDFVMLGPEQLANEEAIAALSGVTLFALDEAHLISQWGRDFRPEYLRLPSVCESLGSPPMLALTATAAPPVQADITRELNMREPRIVVTDFDRPNIHLAVRRTRHDLPEDRAIDDRTVEVVLAHDAPALVYALTHARCESLADRLNLDAYRAAPYHAGLPAARRSQVQDDFLAGRLDVVVATSAFGMGIDKPDVRTVVHAGVPGSLDEYYQEIGRAGRDGQPARAVVVYDPRTIRIPRLLAARSRISPDTVHAVIDAIEAAPGRVAVKAVVDASGVSRQQVLRVIQELEDLGFLEPDGSDGVVRPDRLPPDTFALVSKEGGRQQSILRSRIEAAREFAETVRCRRAELLGYFGEHYDPPCGTCDNDEAAAAVKPQPSKAQVGRRHQPDPAAPRVRHKLWGEGTLLSRDEHELTVAFDTVGYRHLTPAVLENGILTVEK